MIHGPRKRPAASPGARASSSKERNYEPIAKATARAIATSLLAWYDVHQRDLPWRRARDPYAVWVSEMMLQQTQVATVRGYYERWMRRFPTVRSLAEAREEDVLHAWQGLGYYSRARNLWRGARVVIDQHGGRLPRRVDDLRTLPGVGPYSAGAIASIAHGERAAIVDGNVVRVLCRVFGLRGDPTRAPRKADLWARAGALVPEERPGDFNQALMELGATVCLPRNPGCERCPLGARCVARRDGCVETLPELPKRARAVAVARVAVVVWHRARVLCVQVPEGAARWAGMWQFPSTDLAPNETSEAAARRAAREAAGLDVMLGEKALTVRHSVTHHRITLDVFMAEAALATKHDRVPGLAWKTAADLDELAMPAAHRRIARALTPSADARSGASARKRPARVTAGSSK